MTRPGAHRLLKLSLVLAMLVLAATSGRIVDTVRRLLSPPPPPANIIIVAPTDSQTV